MKWKEKAIILENKLKNAYDRNGELRDEIYHLKSNLIIRFILWLSKLFKRNR